MKKLFPILFICLLIPVFVAAGIEAWHIHQDPGSLSLTLNGQQELILEYGQLYQEPGAQARHTKGSKETDVPVEISGTVDVRRLGSYLVQYTAKTDKLERTDYRQVRIVDTVAPVITLTANPDAYTLPGQPYQEEGFYASDNYDGDITKQVRWVEHDGIVTYTVTDASGNTATAERTIRYYDPALPELRLQGGQTAFIMAGDAYAEPGYTASDKYDGDMTAAVSVRGSVDSNTPGIYTIEYSVANHFGNAATQTRTVYVVPRNETAEPLPEENAPTGGTTIEPNGKVIYLTFDDGPGRHTGRLLDILKKYGVKATFFVVNTGSYMDMITRAAQEGHTVAIHTYSHDYNTIYSSDEAFFADLEAMQQVIFERTGQTTMLTRFPGGSSNTISSAYNKGIMSRLTKELTARGYRYFDWNVSSQDAGGARTAEDVFENVVKGIGSNRTSIVLQHDIKGFSVDAVEKIIAWGLCNGYSFQALSYDSPGCHHVVLN